MTASEIEKWCDDLLHPELFPGDPSMNGLQVDNGGSAVVRVAFAVDACQETIERAAQAGAGMLFVHHGLFWGEPLALAGPHYRRIKKLLDSNMALCAYHLPLDAHAEVGNNAGLASRIGLSNLAPFGEWRGSAIGFKGEFADPVSLDVVLSRLFPDGKRPAHVLPFGPKEIRTAAVVSGGASDEVHQAIEQGLDLYITGEIEHEAYHPALENRISVIAAGHYQTETVGIRLVAERLARETSIETVFLDVPTGL
jgi:dinuclear metal center YbgI/SA1388 family protein